jgi:hypothetical protein
LLLPGGRHNVLVFGVLFARFCLMAIGSTLLTRKVSMYSPAPLAEAFATAKSDGRNKCCPAMIANRLHPVLPPCRTRACAAASKQKYPYILREVAGQFRRAVLLYSIGKDSSVLVHLAKKAFHQARPPFPVLHVDTTWKFQEMIAFRDQVVPAYGMELIVHSNADGIARGINSFRSDMASMQQSAERVGMRKNPAPRSAFSPSAQPRISGIRSGNAQSSGASTMACCTLGEA